MQPYSRQLSLSAFSNDWCVVLATVYYSLSQSKSYRLGLHSCPGTMASVCLYSSSAAFMNYDERNFKIQVNDYTQLSILSYSVTPLVRYIHEPSLPPVTVL